MIEDRTQSPQYTLGFRLFSKPHSRFRGVFLQTMLLLSITVVGLVACKKKAPPPPPPNVQIITVAPTNVPISEEWIGTLDGFVNAQIHAQVSGYLLKQDYAEGTPVKKGDVLFEIDPRPFQAAVDQALARLAEGRAQAGKTQLDVNRYTPLAKEQAVSQELLDNAVQANLAAQADLKADEANIETARLNLEFTKITAPVNGIAGIARAQVGDLVGPGTAVLTSVSQIDPIKVYFNVGETSYLTFWQKYANPTDDQSTPPLALALILSDNSIYPEKGKFYIADRQIDINTGTLQIVGLFPNPKLLLRPGQYGRVRAQTQVRTNVFLVPQRAVAELQGTYQVTVVGDQNKAHLRPVTVGPQIGSNWIIETGLTNGDQLIVEGAQKAKENTVVKTSPYHPSANTNAPAGGTNSPGGGTNAADGKTNAP